MTARTLNFLSPSRPDRHGRDAEANGSHTGADGTPRSKQAAAENAVLQTRLTLVKMAADRADLDRNLTDLVLRLRRELSDQETALVEQQTEIDGLLALVQRISKKAPGTPGTPTTASEIFNLPAGYHDAQRSYTEQLDRLNTQISAVGASSVTVEQQRELESLNRQRSRILFDSAMQSIDRASVVKAQARHKHSATAYLLRASLSDTVATNHAAGQVMRTARADSASRTRTRAATLEALSKSTADMVNHGQSLIDRWRAKMDALSSQMSQHTSHIQELESRLPDTTRSTLDITAPTEGRVIPTKAYADEALATELRLAKLHEEMMTSSIDNAAELDALRLRTADLEKQNGILSAALAEAENVVRQTQQEMTALISSEAFQKDQFRTDAETLADHLDRLKEQNASLSDERADLLETLGESSNEVAGLKVHVRNLMAKVESMTLAKDEVTAHRDDLRQQLADSEKERRELQAKLEDALEKILQTDARWRELMGRYDELEKIHQEASKDKKTFEGLSPGETVLSLNERAQNALRDRDALLASNAAIQSESASLKQQLDAVNAALNDVRRQRKEQERVINEINDAAAASRRASEDKHASLTNLIEDLHVERQKLRAEKEMLQSAVHMAEQTNADLSNQVLAMEARIADSGHLMEEVSAQRNELRRTLTEVDKERRNLHEELEVLLQKSVTMDGQRAEAGARADEAIRTRDALKREVDRLAKSVSDSEQQMSNMRMASMLGSPTKNKDLESQQRIDALERELRASRLETSEAKAAARLARDREEEELRAQEQLRKDLLEAHNVAERERLRDASSRSDVERALAAATAEANALRLELQGASARMADSESMRRSLETHRDDLRRSLAETVDERRSLSSRLEASLGGLAKAETRAKEFADRCETLTNAVSSGEERITAMSRKLEEMERANGVQAQRVAALSKELSDARLAVERLEREKGSALLSLQEAHNHVEELSAARKAAEKQSAELAQSVSAHNRQADAAGRDAARAAEQEKAAMADNISRLQLENKTLRAGRDALQSTASTLEVRVAGAQETQRELERQRDDLHAKLLATDNERKRLEKELETSYATMQEKLTEARERAAQLATEAAGRAQSRDAAADVKAATERLTDQIHDLETRLAAVTSERDGLSTAAAASKTVADRQVEAANERLAQRDTVLATLRSELQQARTDLDRSNAQAQSDAEVRDREEEKLRTELANARAKNNDVERALALATAERNSLRLDIQGVQSRLNDAESSKRAVETHRDDLRRSLADATEERRETAARLQAALANVASGEVSRQELAGRYETSRQRVEQLEADIVALRTQLGKIDSESMVSRDSVAGVARENEELRAAKLTAETASAGLTADVRKLGQELATAKQESLAAQDRLAARDAENAALLRDLEATRADLKKADEAAARNHTRSMEETQARASQHADENKARQSQLTLLETQLRTAVAAQKQAEADRDTNHARMLESDKERLQAKAQANTAATRVGELTDQLRELTARFNEAQSRWRETENGIDGQRENTRMLTDRVGTLTTELHQLKLSHAQATSALEAARSELDMKSHALIEARSDLAEQTSRRDALNRQLEDARARAQVATTERDAARAAKDDMSNESARAQRSYEDEKAARGLAERALASETGRVAGLEATLREIEMHRDELRASLSAATGERRELQVRLEDTLQRLSAAEGEGQEAKGRLEEVARNRSGWQAEKEQLTQLLAAKDAAVAAANTRAEAQAQQLKAAETRAATATGQLTALQQTSEATEERAKAAEQRAASVAQAKERETEAMKESASASREAASKARDLADQLQQLQAAKAEADAKVAALETTNEGLADTINHMIEDMATMQAAPAAPGNDDAMTTLMEELADVHEKLANTTRELDELRAARAAAPATPSISRNPFESVSNNPFDPNYVGSPRGAQAGFPGGEGGFLPPHVMATRVGGPGKEGSSYHPLYDGSHSALPRAQSSSVLGQSVGGPAGVRGVKPLAEEGPETAAPFQLNATSLAALVVTIRGLSEVLLAGEPGHVNGDDSERHVLGDGTVGTGRAASLQERLMLQSLMSHSGNTPVKAAPPAPALTPGAVGTVANQVTACWNAMNELLGDATFAAYSNSDEVDIATVDRLQRQLEDARQGQPLLLARVHQQETELQRAQDTLDREAQARDATRRNHARDMDDLRQQLAEAQIELQAQATREATRAQIISEPAGGGSAGGAAGAVRVGAAEASVYQLVKELGTWASLEIEESPSLDGPMVSVSQFADTTKTLISCVEASLKELETA